MREREKRESRSVGRERELEDEGREEEGGERERDVVVEEVEGRERERGVLFSPSSSSSTWNEEEREGEIELFFF